MPEYKESYDLARRMEQEKQIRFWDTVQQAPWQSEKPEICFWKK